MAAEGTKTFKQEQTALTGTTFRVFSIPLNTTFKKLSTLLQEANKTLPKGLILQISFETISGNYEYRDKFFQMAKQPAMGIKTRINALDVLNSLEIRAPAGTPTLLIELIIQEN